MYKNQPQWQDCHNRSKVKIPWKIFDTNTEFSYKKEEYSPRELACTKFQKTSVWPVSTDRVPFFDTDFQI